jgi:hypothetical protein
MLKIIIALMLAISLTGCASTMRPGRMYAMPGEQFMKFSIEKSHGQGNQGKLTAFNDQTQETFAGQYSAYLAGKKVRAEGNLVGDKGTNIKLRFTIKPGISGGKPPTGRGTGIDGAGKRYEVFY